MSIQAPLVFLKEGAEVYRTQIPVGYTHVDRSEFAMVADAILTANTARHYLLPRNGQELPPYDSLEVRVPGGDAISITRYEGLDPIHALEKAGVPTEQLVVQVRTMVADLKRVERTRDAFIALQYAEGYLYRLERKAEKENAQ